MWRSNPRRLSRQRGHAMVEFLLSTFFLFTIIFCIVQFTVFVYMYVTLAEAAKTGVRYAIVHGAKNSMGSGPGTPDTTAASVESAARTWANYPGMTVTVTYPDGSANPPSRVRVAITTPFSLLPGWSFTNLRAAAEGRIMN